MSATFAQKQIIIHSIAFPHLQEITTAFVSIYFISISNQENHVNSNVVLFFKV